MVHALPVAGLTSQQLGAMACTRSTAAVCRRPGYTRSYAGRMIVLTLEATMAMQGLLSIVYVVCNTLYTALPEGS